jgi:broad specificity phosphatase PhoE
MSEYKITQILLVRHAESFNNILFDKIRQIHGDNLSEEFIMSEELRMRQPDSDLSDVGYQQVDILENYVRNHGLANAIDETSNDVFKDWIVISSPMKRCLLTSGAISRGLNHKKVYVLGNLYESGGLYQKDFVTGKVVGLTGATASEIEEQYPDSECFQEMENGWYKRETMETYPEFQCRAKSIVEWLWNFHHTSPEHRHVHGISGQNLILIIHGNLLNAVISGLLETDGLITHNNTGITRMELLTEYTAGVLTRQVAVIKFVNRIDHLLFHSPTEQTSSVIDDQQSVSKKIKTISNSISTESIVKSKPLVTGNHTVNDHWIQEFEATTPTE